MNLIPHNRLSHGSEEEQAVARVVRSGRWVAGRELAELESRLAAVAGVGHAVGVGSGVAALRLALLSLRIGPGDAVAVPAYSCVALPNAVLACGAEVVPVDVQPGSWNICPLALRAARSRCANLRAVIAVHTFGCPAQTVALMSEGLPVIEDCSHGIGHGELGGVGHLAVLSLYASKLLGAGEGGMVLTNDPALAARVRDARDYADKAPSASRLNDKMTDLEAALALCQLDRLPWSLARRAELARHYTAAFEAQSREHACFLPVNAAGRVWYRFAVGVDQPDEVIASMARQGVTAARPVENWGGATAETPVALAAYARLVSLPLYPTLTRAEQAQVCHAFAAALPTPCLP